MGSSADGRASRNALIAGAVGHFFARGFEATLPVLAVVIARQTVASLDQVIGWMILAYLLYGAGALPAGLLVARVSARLVLVVALFGTGVGALAASEAPNGHVLSLCLGLMGGCAASCRPAAAALLWRAAGDRRSARRSAVWVGRAALVVFPTAVALTGLHLRWDGVLGAMGYALCGAAVAASFLRIRDASAGRPLAVAPPAARPGWAPPDWLALAAAGLSGVTATGAMILLPAYLSARVAIVGFGPATSIVMAAGLLGAVLLRRRPDIEHRLIAPWALGATAALLLMTVSADAMLLAAAATVMACALAIRGTTDRWIAAAMAPRSPVLTQATATVSGALAAALGAWIVAATVEVGLDVAVRWLAAVQTLALLLAWAHSTPRRAAALPGHAAGAGPFRR